MISVPFVIDLGHQLGTGTLWAGTSTAGRNFTAVHRRRVRIQAVRGPDLGAKDSGCVCGTKADQDEARARRCGAAGVQPRRSCAGVHRREVHRPLQRATAFLI